MLRVFRKGVGRLVAAAVPMAAAAALMPASAHAATIDLGDASNYAVLAIDSFQFNGPGSITGNVGIGQSMNFASPAVVNGTVFLNTGVAKTGNVAASGGYVTADLSSAISSALSEASTLKGLTATQTFGTLPGGFSITGNGGVNVVDVAGINMSSGALTLSGNANDIFIINVSGDFKSSNSDMVLSGGVTANHVLFNITGNVAITGGGGNNFYGTILAPSSDVSVHDKNLTGEIIGNTIEDTSGFTVTGTPAVPLPAPLVASAALMALLGLGYLGQHYWIKTA